jgi:hypothetical protein
LGNEALKLSAQQKESTNFIRNAISGQEELSELDYNDAITGFLSTAGKYKNLLEEIEAEKENIKATKTENEIKKMYAE